jgi:hypothetical protein
MKKHIKVIFIFSLIGILFSGYLTFSKLFSDTCPLKEGCSYFLGYPACFYGFVLFLILFIISLTLMLNNIDHNNLVKIIFYVSLLGIIFSTYTSLKEIINPPCLNGVCSYSLLIPTCVYGLMMYIIIFVTSILALKNT